MTLRRELHVEAYRTMSFACAAVFITQSAYFFIDYATLGIQMAWIDAGHALLALAFGVCLWICRQKIPSVDVLDFLFFLLFIPFLFAICIGEGTALQLGQIREPLVPFQILMIYLAILAPGRVWLAAVEIGISLAVAVTFWFSLQGKQHSISGVTSEPWLTLLFGAIAIMLLGARVYRRSLIQKLAKSRAEAEAFERAARLFLVVRDRTNTPLQIMELGATLIEARCPTEIELVTRMRRAITRLRDLSDILAETENWRETYSAGGDISAEIEKTFKRLQ